MQFSNIKLKIVICTVCIVHSAHTGSGFAHRTFVCYFNAFIRFFFVSIQFFEATTVPCFSFNAGFSFIFHLNSVIFCAGLFGLRNKIKRREVKTKKDYLLMKIVCCSVFSVFKQLYANNYYYYYYYGSL